MKSAITAIGTALPSYRLPRAVVAESHVVASRAEGALETRIRAIHRASGIQTRYSVIPDFLQNGHDSSLFSKGFQDPFPGTDARMEVYRRTALPLAKQAVEQAFEQRDLAREAITHVVVVSCTGMYAPGLDIDLVSALGLGKHVHRTAINFMGCYGAFPAMKVADAFCKADPKAKVLVVCVELCSLHFQQATDEDTLLAMALFGDGAAALLVEAADDQPRLEIEAFHSGLAPEGRNDMAWKIGDLGFEMKLSSYVPKVIESGIAPLTQSLMQALDMELSQVNHFAIHPGGRSILQAIESQLEISPEQNHHAYEVLKECGNMSSPTVLFVLQRVWQELQNTQTEGPILSFAFGPGLTLESSLFTAYQ
ncbi:MAG: type III polyketide synthase [Bacteroidota bacterium]